MGVGFCVEHDMGKFWFYLVSERSLQEERPHTTGYVLAMSSAPITKGSFGIAEIAGKCEIALPTGGKIPFTMTKLIHLLSAIARHICEYIVHIPNYYAHSLPCQPSAR